MNVNEALVEILNITARPDKEAFALSGINSAISFFTLKGEFEQDLVEASLSIDPSVYGDTIPLTSLTRFRKFSYVKPTAVSYYLNPISPEQVFTPKNKMQPNVYYIAGTNLTYTLSALAPSLEVGYYTYPITLDTAVNNTHWMLDVIPYAVINLAAAYVFSNIGDEASAVRHEAIGMRHYLAYRRDVA